MPVLGIFEHPHFPADRYSLAVSIILSVFIAECLVDASRKIFLLLTPLLVGVPLVLGIISYGQVEVWQDTSKLCEHVLKTMDNDSHDNYRAFIYMKLTEYHSTKLQFALAEKFVRKAINLIPNEANYSNTLAILLAQQGKKAEARAQFEKLVHLYPNFAAAHFNLALLLANLHDYSEALHHAESASRIEPDNPEFRGLIGAIKLAMK